MEVNVDLRFMYCCADHERFARTGREKALDVLPSVQTITCLIFLPPTLVEEEGWRQFDVERSFSVHVDTIPISRLLDRYSRNARRFQSQSHLVFTVLPGHVMGAESCE